MANRQGDVDLRFAQVSAPSYHFGLAEINYFNIGIQQKTQLQESFKKASCDLKKDWTVAISRRASQFARRARTNCRSTTAIADVIRAAICPSSTAAQVHCAFTFETSSQADHDSKARRNYPSISLRNLRDDCTTLTKINIICVLLWLSINNPAVSHTVLKLTMMDGRSVWNI